MANLEKHKKNFAQEWLDAEESTLPAQARSSHVLGAYIKIPKTPARKPRRTGGQPEAPKPDVALMREPAASKTEEKHSQATSPEHLRKVQRLPKLRAPFSPRPSSGSRA